VLLDTTVIFCEKASRFEPCNKTAIMEKAPEVEDNKIEPVARAGECESMYGSDAKNLFTEDEYQLAKLGYKQEFFRGLGLFENWYAAHR
jgi:hypothetical protein